MKDLKFYIKSGLTETELVHSPDGWDEALLEVDRSTKFLGIVRSYSVNLKFVLDGAVLLRSLFYNRIQDEAFIIIKKQHPISLIHQNIYTGQIDFSTFQDSEYSVSVTVLDNDLSNLIKKNIDKQYQVVFSSSDMFYWMENSAYVKPTNYEYFHKVLRWILDKVTDGRLIAGEFALDVDYLIAEEAKPERQVLTNSAALSGGIFDRITMSLSELLQTIYVLFDLVSTVEIVDDIQTLVFKPTSITFPENPYFELTKIDNVKISLAKDFVYDTVLVGHPTMEYDEGNEPEWESNATVKFGNDSSFIVNSELDLASKIRADQTGILQYHSAWGYPDSSEFIPFVVSLHYVDNKFTIETGNIGFPVIQYANALNLRVSPKRLLMKHSRFVDSCYFGSNNMVDFLSAPFKINSLITITYNAPADTQNEGTGYSRSGTPFFIPLYIELEGLMPADFDYNMISVPNCSRIRFNYKDVDFEGFIMNMKLKLVGKVKASVKLLCAPTNDLTKLIR